MNEFLIIIPQITLHNSSLVTSPTTLTPRIASACNGQSLTCLKLAYPLLERPRGTPKLGHKGLTLMDTTEIGHTKTETQRIDLKWTQQN